MNNNTTNATTAEPDFVGFTECGMRVEVRFKDKPAAPQPLAGEHLTAGSKYFENYTDAGAEVKKVLRSVVILRVFPGESYESENYGAIVEMTDGRVLTLVTDSYYGNIDEWNRAEAEAQLAMVEENAAELRAVLASWPDERPAADIKTYGTQLPLEDWLRLHMLDTPVVASDAEPSSAVKVGAFLPRDSDSERKTKQLHDALEALGADPAFFKGSAGGLVGSIAPSSEPILVVDSLEPAPAEEEQLSLDEICAQAGVDRAEYERVRAAAGLPPHGSLGEMPFDVRAPAYAFAVSRGHSQEEAEAFAEFVDKHPFSIRSNLPLNAETFDAAHAFAQAAVVKVELSEEAARRLEYLAKRPVVIPSPIMSAKSYQRVKDAASTRWEKAVWDAPDADLLAIAERYSPDEVDEYARSRVAGATGYSRIRATVALMRGWTKRTRQFGSTKS